MDLFDFLPEDPDAPSHMLMPNMGLACGVDLLTTRDPWVMNAEATTCPSCHEAAEPRGGIHAWCEAMQGR